MQVQMRLYLADIDARLVDVRKVAECHRPDDYAPSQSAGVSLREAGRDGVLYRSVRHAGGTCAAIFRPRLISRCRQSKHYALHFDGKDIVAIDELKAVWQSHS